MALRRLDQLVSSLRSTHQYLDSLLRESLTDEQVELARDQLETYDRELDQAWSLFGRIRDDLSDRREARLGDTLEELVEARREIESLLDRHERGEGDADGRSGTGGDTTTGTGSGTGDSPATDGGRSGTDPARAAAVDAATDGWFRAGFLLSGASLSVAGYYILLGLFRLLDPTRSVVENVPQAFTISWVGGGLLLWFVTSRWTSAVESTGAPDAVYDGLLVRPGRVKQAVIVGLGAAIVTELLPLPTAVDDVVSPTLGLLFWGSVVLYGFTQVYHVTLERIGS
ncbi:hypothetical protein BRD17_03575 [Halobacteriales archaeon SW_7_68_16]|nr:MAG: hypothetical protein BRD17_03575 [Halobacteriales archaeon SW_7_68_16]